MGLNLISYPQIVFAQSLQPTAIIGRFWVDTDDGSISSCNNGATFTKLNVNIGELQTPILENSLEILNIQAASTLTATDSASVIGEIYYDANGFRDTIDTGNTDATFSTDKYGNAAAPTDETISPSGSGYAYGETLKNGIKILTNSAIVVTGFTLYPDNSASKCYVLNSAKEVIATGTCDGINASIYCELENATTYYFCVDNEGASFTSFKKTGASFPDVNTSVNITGGLVAGADDAGEMRAIWHLLYLAAAPTDKVVTTNEQTLENSPTKFQIYTYGEELISDGSIDYDISFNGGTNYQTDIESGTPTDIINIGTGLILKQNLKKGTGGVASSKGYGVLIW